MLDVSAAYTAAIKDKNRTDRIAGTIKLCDGETINITDDIIVNNSVTLKEQLVSGDTFEIGTFYTNQLDITVYDNNFLSRSYANARITPKYEIQLAGGTWESVPLGVFTVDNSLTKRKGSIHKLTAFDDSTKFDVDISAYSGGKKTVQQHIKNLAADVGITLATTDFSSYPNYNLIVDSTVSSSVQTYRDLIEWCCALMSASARINRYGKFEIVKLKEKTKTVDGVLVYDADYTVEGYERTGTEFFDLRAMTKYFSTTFDGEQYVYANSSVLEDTVARKATLFLPENPLLRSASDRKAAFEACADAINIALRRVEFSFNGNPAIECFDTLCGNGGKIDVNRTIAFFPTSLVWKYRGAHKVSCAFAELTDEATASASEAAILVAADASTISKIPVQVKSKTEKRLDGVGKTASDAAGVGKFTNTDKNCEIFNDYENNVASAYYSHAEGYMTTASAPYSHAEGESTVASNMRTHAEGWQTTASGNCSHAENTGCIASGSNSHAEGYYTMATGEHSHASGNHTVAGSEVFALGRYNKKAEDVALVVGNGWGNDSYEHRSDAMTLDYSGNLHISGKLTADGGVGYVLHKATADTLGGVKIGANISVTADGTISVDLSAYLKSADISEWAKQSDKPTYTASEIGLGNVDNTADADKPISTATQTALDGKADTGHTHTKSQITDFPTLGTAAGKNAADFYPAKAASVLGGDYNELKTNGIFEMQGNAANPTANTPNGSHVNNNFYVQVFYRNPKYLTQIATSVRADKTQYIRSLNNGVWNNWEKIKSGDADTLDGKHASDIAADITAAVNAVEIGGRNLLYYSRFDKKYPAGWAYSEEVTYTFDDEVTTLTKAETASRHFTTQASVSNGVVVANPNLVPENGCTYTISCEVMKAEGYDVGEGTKVTAGYNYTDGTVRDFDVDVSGASETAWTKYSRTYTYASDKTVSYTQFIIALGAKACGIRIKNVKFEKGNKPTDWTPAPEDDERRIASLEARVAALEAAAVSGGEV